MIERTKISKYVVVYDICIRDNSPIEIRMSARRRMKIMRILYSYGIRTQLSVFEVELSPSQKEEMLRKVRQYLRESTDRFYVYPIDSRSFDNIIRIGNYTNTLLVDLFL